MTQDERDELKKILTQLEDNEKTMKRIEKFLFVVIAIMIIALGRMTYLTYL